MNTNITGGKMGTKIKRLGFVGLLVLISLSFITPVFASVAVYVNDDNKGIFEKLNFPSTVTVTQDGTKADIAITAGPVAAITSGTASGVTITGSTVNSSIIGGSSPAAGTFTTLTSTGAFIGSLENVSMTSADPAGLGTASLVTLTTEVTTHATGASSDVLSLADGTTGQLKIINLKVSNETSGLKVTPTNIKGATTDVLLGTTGDSVTLVFDGTAWNVIATTGTRE